MMQVYEERNSPLLETWRKLRTMVVTLGIDGMSDEESGTEEHGYSVVKVAIVEWRRQVGDELRVVDEVKYRWPELFKASGAKPRPRVRNESAGDRFFSQRLEA